MAVQVSYPGVYIDEFAPGAPIQGVGTSTAAFLGPASAGPLNEPTKITNWDAFKTTFGALPVAGFYLWYAVRGFFENGGAVCYVTRVSNAAPATLSLNDINGSPTINIQARQPGTGGDQIQITIEQDDPALAATGGLLFKPVGTVSNAAAAAITVANADEAGQFQPGDTVFIDDGTNSETAAVYRPDGDTIRLQDNLANTYTNGSVRLADTVAGDTTVIRVSGEGLGSGSVIQLSQDQGGPNPVTETAVVSTVQAERLSPTVTTYRVTLRQALTEVFDLSAAANDTTVESFEFKLTVTHDGDTVDYEKLGMDPAHPNYYRSVINNASGLVTAAPVSPPNVTAVPDNRPATLAATNLAGGVNDDPTALSSVEYKAAIKAHEPIDDVNFMAIPDRTDADVQLAMLAHCENMMDRFAIFDSRRGDNLFGNQDSVEAHRNGLDSARGYGALYYPWLLVAPASGTDQLYVPPSGHVAGIYARTDTRRGVFKAPAGREATLNGVLGVEKQMSNTDQGQLNLQGINIIRVFSTGGRAIVWGARTTATDSNWQYVNIRRLFLFLEESIQEGIEWAVFEPNNLQLWQKLKRTITDFLTRMWRDGAIFGEKPENAFYVRIDEVLNPFSEQALGRLNIEIGVRPSYPAEFIIVRIGIWDGGSNVSEG